MSSKQEIVAQKIGEFIKKWYYYPDMSLLHWVFIDQNEFPSYKESCTCENGKEYVECLYYQKDGHYIMKRFAFNVEYHDNVYPIKEQFPENIPHPYLGYHAYNNHIYNDYFMYNLESSSSSYSEDSEQRGLREYFKTITILEPKRDSKNSSRNSSRNSSKNSSKNSSRSSSRSGSRRNSRHSSLRNSLNSSLTNSRTNSRRNSTKLSRKDSKSKSRKSDFETFFPCSL